MEYSALDFTNAIRFIKAYRAMEENTLTANKQLIRATVEPNQFKHLYNSWAGRKDASTGKYQFDSFFLNLGYKNQAAFLTRFGIEIPGIGAYLDELNSNRAAHAYATPPVLISQLHELIKFFYNNGISENAVPGIKLYYLPEDCYGNSTNWGNYILGLGMTYQLPILKQIAVNCIQDIQRQEENRAFIKNHLTTQAS